MLVAEQAGRDLLAWFDSTDMPAPAAAAPAVYTCPNPSWAQLTYWASTAGADMTLDSALAAAAAAVAAEIAKAAAICDTLWPPTARQAGAAAWCRKQAAEFKAACIVLDDQRLSAEIRDAACEKGNRAYDRAALWLIECEKKWAADPSSHPRAPPNHAVCRAHRGAAVAWLKDVVDDFEDGSAAAVDEVPAAAERAAIALGSAAAIDLPEPTMECLVPAHLREAVIALQAADAARRAFVPAHTPTLAEWEASDRSSWACEWCRGPALAGAYHVGRICSLGCAISLKGY